MTSEQETLDIYVSTALGTVHDFIDSIIKLRTENKSLQLLVDRNIENYGLIISEKDKEIRALFDQLEKEKKNFETLSANRESNFISQLAQNKEQYNFKENENTNIVIELKNRISALESKERSYDSAIKSILDLKAALKDKDEQIKQLKIDWDKLLADYNALNKLAVEEKRTMENFGLEYPKPKPTKKKNKKSSEKDSF